VLKAAKPYRHALVCVDGVYSMSGSLPPLRDLERVARAHDGVLYVDDAHGTGVLGRRGRGSVLECLDNYDNVLVVGSLSKALSCLGGFIGCPAAFQTLLKMRSNTYIFGGPVPPPYLDGLLAALDIVDSDEYDRLHAALTANVARLVHGAEDLDLTVLGGLTPIVSVLVGDEAHTLQAGYFLFERGHYVQSVVFPAVPFRAGVLRLQVNANHSAAQIDGLLTALAELRTMLPLPSPAAARAA
jgi:7-keto-8-aminopelargonate synthetase-like enzyme